MKLTLFYVSKTLSYVSKTLLFIPILDNLKNLSNKQTSKPKNKGYILCFYNIFYYLYSRKSLEKMEESKKKSLEKVEKAKKKSLEKVEKKIINH